jgi:hypothetical protein
LAVRGKPNPSFGGDKEVNSIDQITPQPERIHRAMAAPTAYSVAPLALR